MDYLPNPIPSSIEINYFEPDSVCSINSTTCLGSLVFPFEVNTPNPASLMITYELQIDGQNLEADTFGMLTGDYPDFSIEGEYPIGNYQILLELTNGEEDTTFVQVPFLVVDCRAPLPFCINGLVVDVDVTNPGATYQDGNFIGIKIAAADLLQDTMLIDCSGPIHFSANHPGDPVDPEQDSLFIEVCEPAKTLIVQIYAWDSANNPYTVQPDGQIGGPNYDFCETYLLIQSNGCYPIPNAHIGGIIETEEQEPMGGVDVYLDGEASSFQSTLPDGSFIFEQIEPGFDYSVIPMLDEDYLNGTSTFDLILIRKHILGVQHLGSPYKMIAADVNNSQSISTLDLITLLQTILAIEDGFPDNTSWRFIDASYDFPDPDNPWVEDFPEAININNLEENTMENANFIGVKIGDLNSSAVVN